MWRPHGWFHEANLTLYEHIETFKSFHIRQPGGAFLSCMSVFWVTEPQNKQGGKGHPEVMWSNLPSSGKATERWWPRNTATQLLSILAEDRDATSALDYLCQCLVTLKKHFLIFRGKLLCFSLCPLSLGTHKNSLAYLVSVPLLQLLIYVGKDPLQSLLQAEQPGGSSLSPSL